MGMLRKNNNDKDEDIKPSGNKTSHSIKDVSSTIIRKKGGINVFDTRKTYHGYQKQKERVVRISKNSHQMLKALAGLGYGGKNMRECFDSIIDSYVSKFDNKSRAEFEKYLEFIEEADKKHEK